MGTNDVLGHLDSNVWALYFGFALDPLEQSCGGGDPKKTLCQRVRVPPVDRKIKVAAIVALVAVVVPLSIYGYFYGAATKVEVVPRRLLSIRFQAQGLSVVVDVETEVRNPTRVNFPPTSVTYQLVVEGVDLGKGVMPALRLPAGANITTNVTQYVGALPALALLPKVLGKEVLLVEVRIVELKVDWLVLPVDVRVVRAVNVSEVIESF
ncbi:MAG: hypothetical protein Kow0069_08930 [Promethearchaeota archaeon]